jgi:excisionase family DNA binding protein
LKPYHPVDASPQHSFDVIPERALSQLYAPSAVGKQLFTDVEVARYLTVSVFTVRRWRIKGGGPRWIRIGSSIRYHIADLHAYIAGVPSGGGAPGAAIRVI